MRCGLVWHGMAWHSKANKCCVTSFQFTSIKNIARICVLTEWRPLLHFVERFIDQNNVEQKQCTWFAKSIIFFLYLERPFTLRKSKQNLCWNFFNKILCIQWPRKWAWIFKSAQMGRNDFGRVAFHCELYKIIVLFLHYFTHAFG